MLIRDGTGSPFTHGKLRLQMLHRFTPARMAYQFPDANSLSIALSSSASASNFFSRKFLSSSSLSRFASGTFIPPYLVFQR